MQALEKEDRDIEEKQESQVMQQEILNELGK